MDSIALCHISGCDLMDISNIHHVNLYCAVQTQSRHLQTNMTGVITSTVNHIGSQCQNTEILLTDWLYYQELGVNHSRTLLHRFIVDMILYLVFHTMANYSEAHRIVMLEKNPILQSL